jgi:acetolactate synthase small subunit
MLIDDQYGALARITALFQQRRYGIRELTMEPSEHHPGLQDLCLTITPSRASLDQITRQLAKVLGVLEINRQDSTEGG